MALVAPTDLRSCRNARPQPATVLGRPGQLGDAAVRDRRVGGAVAAGLLLQEAEAVGLEQDDHRLAEVLRALHEDLEVAEVAAHRRRVLHLLQERRLAAARLAVHLVVLHRRDEALAVALAHVAEAPRPVVRAEAPVVDPALGEVAVARVPRARRWSSSRSRRCPRTGRPARAREARPGSRPSRCRRRPRRSTLAIGVAFLIGARRDARRDARAELSLSTETFASSARDKRPHAPARHNWGSPWGVSPPTICGARNYSISSLSGLASSPPPAAACSVGAVPSRKTSSSVFDSCPAAASRPLALSMRWTTIPGGCAKSFVGTAGHRLGHEVGPDGRRRLAARLAAPELLHVVEADPDRGQQVGREADEPGVALVVRRAGLARRRAPQLARDRARARSPRRPRCASATS